jgi:probable phosphoglycerate mutase
VRIVLVRHGETEWSRDGRHTGRTDVPLTDAGREQASLLSRRLAARSFALVLVSPRERAQETARLAGLAEHAKEDAGLAEWDYGDYEGRTTADIRRERPGWELWRDGCPGGESPEDVGARVDRVIERALAAGGDVALVAHGHVLRALGARWVGLPPAGGRLLALDTAALCELGFEHAGRVIERWNVT